MTIATAATPLPVLPLAGDPAASAVSGPGGEASGFAALMGTLGGKAEGSPDEGPAAGAREARRDDRAAVDAAVSSILPIVPPTSLPVAAAAIDDRLAPALSALRMAADARPAAAPPSVDAPMSAMTAAVPVEASAKIAGTGRDGGAPVEATEGEPALPSERSAIGEPGPVSRRRGPLAGDLDRASGAPVAARQVVPASRHILAGRPDGAASAILAQAQGVEQTSSGAAAPSAADRAPPAPPVHPGPLPLPGASLPPHASTTRLLAGSSTLVIPPEAPIGPASSSPAADRQAPTVLASGRMGARAAAVDKRAAPARDAVSRTVESDRSVPAAAARKAMDRPTASADAITPAPARAVPAPAYSPTSAVSSDEAEPAPQEAPVHAGAGRPGTSGRPLSATSNAAGTVPACVSVPTGRAVQSEAVNRKSPAERRFARPEVMAAPAMTASIPDGAAAAGPPPTGHGVSVQAADRHLDLARASAWIDGIARDIAGATAGGDSRFTVSPGTLGTVHVAITRDGGVADVAITAASPEAGAALAEGRQSLVSEARTHGLEIRHATVEVAASPPDRPPAHPADGPSTISLTDRGYGGGVGTGDTPGRRPHAPQAEWQADRPRTSARTAAAGASARDDGLYA